MPVTNGCSPEAPGGGHSSQAGAVSEAPAAAEPDDRPDPAEPDELAPAPPCSAEPLPLLDEAPSEV